MAKGLKIMNEVAKKLVDEHQKKGIKKDGKVLKEGTAEEEAAESPKMRKLEKQVGMDDDADIKKAKKK